MVHLIQTPMASIAVKAMRIGVAMSQSLIVSRARMKRATLYEVAVVTVKNCIYF